MSHSNALVIRPPISVRISDLTGLRFIPKTVSTLGILQKLSFRLIVTAGRSKLKASSFPRRSFEVPRRGVLHALTNRNILFSSVLVSHAFRDSNTPAHGPHAKVFNHCANKKCSLTTDCIINSHTASVLLTHGLKTQKVLFTRRATNHQVLHRTKTRRTYILVDSS